MYIVYEDLGTYNEVKGRYDDIADAMMVLEELVRDGLQVWMSKEDRNVA